ncbi:MAG: homoserine kinase [Candidatus Thalassarchaeaceae archaeon]
MAYTEVSLKEASEVIGLAGFKELISIQKLDGGWANSNYKLSLSDGTKLVLKIWNEQHEDRVEYLLGITTYLSELGIPTPKPISFNNNEYLIMKNNLPWTILPFIDGEWLGNDYQSLFTLGQIQANMHLAAPPKNLESDFSMGIKLFDKLFKIADERNCWDDFLLTLKSSRSIYEKLDKLPKGIIHGDLFPDNVIRQNDGNIFLLDFEEVCNDILAFDLAMTFVGFGWEEGEPINDRWVAILEGYQSVRKLTKEELDALPDLHKLATLSIAAWRYWQFKINLPGTKHEDRYLEMTDRLEKKLPF